MPEIGIVIVTHGNFGREMLRTAQEMVGEQPHVLEISMTPDMGLDGLGKSLDNVFSRMKDQATGGMLVFVDMLGGTPCNASLPRIKDLNAEVVTGVNLYMLISAFRHRGQLSLSELSQKVMEDAKKSILLPKELLLKRKI